jgi:hypothetical protein
LSFDTRLVLLGSKSGHYDLSRLASGLLGWMCGNKHPINPGQPSPYLSTSYAHLRISRGPK